MSKIILTVGISASGKSTFAEQVMKETKHYVRCNRDEIRKTLFGYTDDNISDYYKEKGIAKREEIVSMVADGIIKAAIRHRKNVIVDNTHLKFKYLEAYKKYGVPIIYRLIDTPVEVCLERDKNRKAQVGEKVIRRQHKQLQQLKKLHPLDSEMWFPENYTQSWDKVDERVHWAKPDPDLPNCVIVDLDGTLSLMNGRSPFEGEKCESDVVNESVKFILDQVELISILPTTIILLSGRNSDNGGRESTKKWLIKNNIPYDQLIMRNAGDTRKDTIVKKEMYEKFVKSNFNVIFVLDDRDVMVEMWRSMKLHTFQVHTGNF